MLVAFPFVDNGLERTGLRVRLVVCQRKRIHPVGSCHQIVDEHAPLVLDEHPADTRIHRPIRNDDRPAPHIVSVLMRRHFDQNVVTVREKCRGKLVAPLGIQSKVLVRTRRLLGGERVHSLGPHALSIDSRNERHFWLG